MNVNLQSTKSIFNLRKILLKYIKKYANSDKSSVWIYFISEKITDTSYVQFKLKHRIITTTEPIDQITYKKYIDSGLGYTSIFKSLDNKTLLIIPRIAYKNLTDFVLRCGGEAWVRLWTSVRMMADLLIQKYGSIYISTHGHGVNYLHIRLERRLKYKF